MFSESDVGQSGIHAAADSAAIPANVLASDVSAAQEMSLVSVNVDGLGNYSSSAEERMANILEAVLRVRPHFLLTQEVTWEMYAEIKKKIG